MKTILLLSAILFLTQVTFCQSNFIKHPTNPILPRTPVFGEWDAIAASDPHVLYHNDTLRMWYTGVGWLSTSDTTVNQRIGYAWSLDGISWNQYVNNPVLDKTDNAWDDLGVETSTVIIDSTSSPNERYKMWYAGQNSISGNYDIGYAYSPDGLNWIKSNANPVLQVGASSTWENGYLEGPSVLLHNDTLRMWYASVDLVGDASPTDFTGNIGYAWSIDGANWNKHVNNPVFTSYNSPGWDKASVADPHVIIKDNQYHMFYAGLHSWSFENFKMGYATSYDGINWTRPVLNPVLETGNDGEWDDEDASYACVIFDANANQFQMWYTGLDTNNLPSDINGYYYEIGYATSDVSLAISENTFLLNELSLFPNPCENSLTLALENSTNLNKIRLFDARGRIIDIPFSRDKSQIILQTEHLMKGFYFIEVTFHDSKKYNGKFYKL
ncbi:MAG TPA: T9SS type A sorting domain-containing protein [Brumimicrobium sp.]|nr:T9SS type A sorting domain-containing protein [Brumimicrobium sp.]